MKNEDASDVKTNLLTITKVDSPSLAAKFPMVPGACVKLDVKSREFMWREEQRRRRVKRAVVTHSVTFGRMK